MACSDRSSELHKSPGGLRNGYVFSWIELSGSLGDLGTFLPLVVAMSLTSHLDFGVILVLAGVMNILTGLLFKQPVPVQPMKALAALVITGELLPDELLAAGLLMGVLLVGLVAFGAVERLVRLVPRSIVRGIQLGVGVKLALKGVDWIANLPLTGLDSFLTATLAAITLFLLMKKRCPAALIVFVAGFVILLIGHPMVLQFAHGGLPRFYLHWPQAGAWGGGFVKGMLTQAPLTLLNSVVAVCALSADYFPGRGIQPRRMAVSVGLMNLVCVPLGGIPMCHGAGGLAAQYRFGARTGGSVIMLGLFKVAAGFLFGAASLSLLAVYPRAILGVMLFFAGLELARAARDLRRAEHFALAFITGGFILVGNTAAGFLAGIATYLVLKIAGRVGRRLKREFSQQSRARGMATPKMEVNE